MPITSSDPTRTPAVLIPTLVARPWGGRRLAQLVRAEDVPEGPIGEAWLAGPESRVVAHGSADPTAAVATLDELARRHGEPFVGSAPFRRYGPRVPLLTKLLDAAEVLSVQVHPDDAYALTHEAASGHLGKTEAWYVLAAEPSAHVLWGWSRDVTAADVRAAVAAERLEPLLRRRMVRAGDVIVNEAGVVHAVGPGIMLFELQQASDLTYRLYDHGRRDAQGRPRDLHLAKALDVAQLTPAGESPAPRAIAPGRERSAATSAFTMERWLVGREGAPARQDWQVEPRSLELWTVLAGTARLVTGAGEVRLDTFASVALPASLGPAAWHGDAVLVRGRV